MKIPIAEIVNGVFAALAAVLRCSSTLARRADHSDLGEQRVRHADTHKIDPPVVE
jgi:hypothetical protein